jgi:hypothetical protein
LCRRGIVLEREGRPVSLCRVTRVAKARKAQGKCGKCQTPIEAGDGYRWWKGRYGPTYRRCLKASCSPKLWELETNATKAQDIEGSTYASYAQGADNPADAAMHLRDALSIAEGLVEDLSERVSNKEGTALESSSEFEALQTSKDEFENWVSEAEAIADDLETLELPDEPEGDEAEDEDGNPTEAATTYAEDYDSFTELQDTIPDWPELDLGSYGPPRPRRKSKATAEATS